MKTRRIDLDIAKGIAIILVVMSHMHQFFAYEGRFYQMAYSVNLPVFLLLGGYWMEVKEGETFQKFAEKKFYRLIKPYFIFCLISILVAWPDAAATARYYIAGMFYAIGIDDHMGFNIPLWFLPMFFVGNCMFYLICRAIHKIENAGGRLIAGAALVLVSIWCGFWILGHYKRLLWGFELAMILQGMFYLGYVWRRVEARYDLTDFWGSMGSRYPWKWLVILPAACLLWFVGIRINGRVDINGAYFNSPVWFYIAAAAGCLVILGISKLMAYIPVLGRFLAFCGVNSIYIMAYHVPSVVIQNDVLREYMPQFIQQNLSNKNLIGIGYVLACGVGTGLFMSLLHRSLSRKNG